MIDIFLDEAAGFQKKGTDGYRIVLEKDSVDATLIIIPTEFYGYTEIGDWVDQSEIGWVTFDRLRYKHCPQ